MIEQLKELQLRDLIKKNVLTADKEIAEAYQCDTVFNPRLLEIFVQAAIDATKGKSYATK